MLNNSKITQSFIYDQSWPNILCRNGWSYNKLINIAKCLSLKNKSIGHKFHSWKCKIMLFSKEFKFYINNELIDFDAFLAYGYMNPKHFLDYLYIN